MKAILLESFGGTEKLKQGEIETPAPLANEILIKIAFTAVNPVDWKIRIGMLEKRVPHDFPIIPGWDAAGTITAIGSEVKNFRPGDAVFAYCRKPTIKWGTYSEYICIPASYAAFKPKNISFAQAASIPLAGLTAWQSVVDCAALKANESILIHAGSGGVGSLAIQFAKQIGAKVFTTCSRSNHEYVKSLGADYPIDYREKDFVQIIKEIEPEGLDVIFDLIGGTTLNASWDLLKKNGRLVSIVEEPDQNLAEQKEAAASYVFVKPNGRQLQEIADLIDIGKVKPPEIYQMPLSNAGEAQELLREGHVRGKIVLKVE